MRNNSSKLILIIVLIGGIIFAGIGAVILAPGLSLNLFLSDNPETAKKIGASIADYTLPEGYAEVQSLNLGVYKMVYISETGQPPHIHARNVIIFASFPSSFNFSADRVQDELRVTLLRNSDEVSTMARVGEESAVLRGEEILLEVHESFGEFDPPTRMVFSPIFKGKTDHVVLMFSGPIAGWDQNLFDQFIRSIK